MGDVVVASHQLSGSSFAVAVSIDGESEMLEPAIDGNAPV